MRNMGRPATGFSEISRHADSGASLVVQNDSVCAIEKFAGRIL